MIIDGKELAARGIEIDLNGPQGNAFYLLGCARRWLKQLGGNGEHVIAEMQSGDYEKLLEVFEREFGEFVTLYR